MDDKDSQKSKVRKRTVKESVERVSDKDNGNGVVKLTNERTEEMSDEPAKETGISPNDDVASKVQSSTPDWENVFRISIEFDGIAVLLFILSFLTRTFRLSQPKDIVFDELHYGKYIRMYNEKTFFFDQHPPLGKQLIAAVTNLVGFGNYTFSKIGASYNEVSDFITLDYPDHIVNIINLLLECPNPRYALCPCALWQSPCTCHLRPLQADEIPPLDSDNCGSGDRPGQCIANPESICLNGIDAVVILSRWPVVPAEIPTSDSVPSSLVLHRSRCWCILYIRIECQVCGILLLLPCWVPYLQSTVDVAL